MKFSKFIFLTLVAGTVFGVLFWRIWGHGLHYNVYSNGEFWYSEDFTEFGKTIITIGVSFLFGICLIAIVWVIQSYLAVTK